MIDYRFSGRGSDNEYVDIRFRTDAISTNDQTFNITQVQKGQNFSVNDKNDDIYQKHLSQFQLKNTTLGEMIACAIANNYDLRSYNSKGVEAWVVNDASASQS
jgi:hypothetical protein